MLIVGVLLNQFGLIEARYDISFTSELPVIILHLDILWLLEWERWLWFLIRWTNILLSFLVCQEVFGFALWLYFAPTFICNYSLMQLFYEFIWIVFSLLLFSWYGTELLDCPLERPKRVTNGMVWKLLQESSLFLKFGGLCINYSVIMSLTKLGFATHRCRDILAIMRSNGFVKLQQKLFAYFRNLSNHFSKLELECDLIWVCMVHYLSETSRQITVYR